MLRHGAHAVTDLGICIRHSGQAVAENKLELLIQSSPYMAFDYSAFQYLENEHDVPHLLQYFATLSHARKQSSATATTLLSATCLLLAGKLNQDHSFTNAPPQPTPFPLGLSVGKLLSRLLAQPSAAPF